MPFQYLNVWRNQRTSSFGQNSYGMKSAVFLFLLQYFACFKLNYVRIFFKLNHIKNAKYSYNLHNSSVIDLKNFQ